MDLVFGMKKILKMPKKALDRGNSFHYLCSREDYEYEYFEYIPEDVAIFGENTTI